MKPELVPALVSEARAKGMRVSGHVPAHMIAEDAVNAGFDELQHINFVMLDLLSTRDDDTRTPLRFTRIAEKGADLDLDAPATKALLDLFVKKHTVIDPTLNVFEGMFTTRPDHPDQTLAPILFRLPPQIQRGAVTRERAAWCRTREWTRQVRRVVQRGSGRGPSGSGRGTARSP